MFLLEVFNSHLDIVEKEINLVNLVYHTLTIQN